MTSSTQLDIPNLPTTPNDLKIDFIYNIAKDYQANYKKHSKFIYCFVNCMASGHADNRREQHELANELLNWHPNPYQISEAWLVLARTVYVSLYDSGKTQDRYKLYPIGENALLAFQSAYGINLPPNATPYDIYVLLVDSIHKVFPPTTSLVDFAVNLR